MNETEHSRGWWAAVAGDPYDETESAQWQAGWNTWHRPRGTAVYLPAAPADGGGADGCRAVEDLIIST